MDAQNNHFSDAVELSVIDPSVFEDAQSHQEFSLPPTDGGKDAWVFLATCFVVEVFVWGFPFSYGVFQEYYSSHEPFRSKPSGLAAIGTTALGVMYLDAPIVFMILQRWPNLRRPSCAVGVVLVAISLIASSFATKVWQLILTQGALYAIGGSLLYNPMLLFLDEWFVKRKGIAFGIMWAGTGASGVAIPFLLSWGLAHFSLSTILRFWGVLMGVSLGLSLPFVKPRLPITMSSTELSRRRFDYSFVSSPAFLALQAGNIMQGLGYFIPGIYLPSYSRSLGKNSAVTTATISMLNATSVFGCIVVGLLVDKFHVTTVLLLTAVGSLLSVFFFWGFSSNTGVLLCFSGLYGFFAGPFTTTYTGMVKEVQRQIPGADYGLVIGLLSVGRGIGSVVAGPISENLLDLGQRKSGKLVTSGYGGSYEELIVFTGICVALGGLSFGARKFGWM